MKIVAIKCPSCNGTKKSKLLGISCLWCKSTGKLRKKEALKYANISITLGSGGYICGDLNWEDRKRMFAEADYITNVFNEPKIAPELAR